MRATSQTAQANIGSQHIATSAPAPTLHSRQSNGHLTQLDCFRGLAIFAVLAFHCLGKTLVFYDGLWHHRFHHFEIAWLLQYPLTLGSMGVSLFFVLSGFVIHHATLRSTSFSLTSFARRRFFRIYPPYLLALICFTLMDLYGGVVHRTVLLSDFAVHVLVIYNLFGWSYYGINSSFWSLAVEMQFYLLYPLVLIAWRRIGSGKTLLAVLAVSTAYRIIGYTFLHWNAEISYYFWLNTPSLWFDWVLGAYLAEQFHRGRRVVGHPLLWAVPLIALLVLADDFKPTSVLCFTIASLISFIAIETTLYSRYFRLPEWRWLIALGSCSYSFYLWHQPLVGILARRLHIDRITHGSIRYPVLLSVSFVSIFALSWMLYITVETWSRNLGKFNSTQQER